MAIGQKASLENFGNSLPQALDYFVFLKALHDAQQPTYGQGPSLPIGIQPQAAGDRAIQANLPTVSMEQPDRMQILSAIMGNPRLTGNPYAQQYSQTQGQLAMLPYQLGEQSAKMQLAQAQARHAKYIPLSWGQQGLFNADTGMVEGASTGQDWLQNSPQGMALQERQRHNLAIENKKQIVVDNQGNATYTQVDPNTQQVRTIPLGKIGKSNTKWNQIKDANQAVVALYNPVTKEVQTPDEYGLNSFSSAPLTQATKTMKETAPKLNDLLDRIEAQIKSNVAQLGPAMGRWNQYMSGKIGAPNPAFQELRTNIGLAQTLAMRMHTGSRSSEMLLREFQDILGAPQQSPQNILAQIRAVREYAGDVGSEGDESNPINPKSSDNAGSSRFKIIGVK